MYFLNHYYNKLKREIYRITGKTSGNILDVGCSGGYFLDIMQEWNRYGIEISDKEASIAKSKYGDNIVSVVIENYPVRESFFDVITLQDVLDHCINPTEVIDSCYKMLKPGGLIIIKVHDISCLYARIRDLRFDNVPFGRTQFAPTLWTKSVTVGAQSLRPPIDWDIIPTQVPKR
ncbi:methyltransferase domain-containing protein [Microcystis aeruginosa FD4]|uniref:Methyltransferase domain-containing protein n=1 Tax=Microcystis aeruginosa FD4 TaxID=2686288 RepID=A0A857DBA7_MICAE|nr:methyltransferase domain-containing protein [Microcystis aeruginosa FD4]